MTEDKFFQLLETLAKDDYGNSNKKEYEETLQAFHDFCIENNIKIINSIKLILHLNKECNFICPRWSSEMQQFYLTQSTIPKVLDFALYKPTIKECFYEIQTRINIHKEIFVNDYLQ